MLSSFAMIALVEHRDMYINAAFLLLSNRCDMLNPDNIDNSKDKDRDGSSRSLAIDDGFR
ncbi:hypothetical protein TIFTF001_020414 [Ficus carica]|uniref:Uncharacterized protein n=1 Tax=Ficus carica TaxID=3494 RepID=A0AA88AEW4_FICCA|nr:hypothetical protein TIFTF001_020414 [Ficus carica]